MIRFKGQVSAISPILSGVSKNGKAWRKIDVVLTYDNTKPEWPKAIKFSVMNDNIEKFNFAQGREYEVDVDFQVREYQGKFYMDATCLNALSTAQTPYPPAASSPYMPNNDNATMTDDLPF